MSKTPSIPHEIGIDLVDISRFKRFKKGVDGHLLSKAFSSREIAYCFGYKQPAPHLAGMFAAKEAASKALGLKKYPFCDLEVRHARDGRPEMWKNGRKLPVRVSITHSDTAAAAVVIS